MTTLTEKLIIGANRLNALVGRAAYTVVGNRIVYESNYEPPPQILTDELYIDELYIQDHYNLDGSRRDA
jgi:hypothetical protein